MIIKNVTQMLHDTHYEWFVRNSSYVCLVQVLWKPPCCWLQASEATGLSTAITETFMVVSGEYTCFDHGSSCTFTLVWMWTEASCHACCCPLECVCVSWQQLQQASPCVLWLVHYRMNYLWETKRQIKDIFSSQEINIPSISDSRTLC